MSRHTTTNNSGHSGACRRFMTNVLNSEIDVFSKPASMERIGKADRKAVGVKGVLFLAPDDGYVAIDGIPRIDQIMARPALPVHPPLCSFRRRGEKEPQAGR